MEIKRDRIGKRTPSLAHIAHKHGASLLSLRDQLKKGIGVEKEHTHSSAEAREIALDHLAEFPDYYSRLLKMERRAKREMRENWVDPIEAIHNATRARILQGAKEGKYWLLRSEERMTEEQRNWLISHIMETVTTASIGGYNKPLGVDSRDIAMGRRNRWTKEELAATVQELLNRRSGARPRP